MKHFNKYLNILYWIMMLLLLFWFSYSKGWILANFKSIDAKTAISLIENDNNISLLDVRTIEEYKEGHLRDAKLIPLQKLPSKLIMLKEDKQKQIIVYCRSGSRSVAASRILKKHGFTPLNVKGGIIQLTEEKAEIVK